MLDCCTALVSQTKSPFSLQRRHILVPARMAINPGQAGTKTGPGISVIVPPTQGLGHWDVISVA